MGAPVVHFEILGKDQAALSAFYGEIFDWKVDANNPVGYGMVDRDSNLNKDGIGIGGGIMGMPEGPDCSSMVTFYVEVPSVEDALAHAERLGGKRLMGPESPMEGLVIGMFADPEGHPIGVIQS